MSHQATKWVWDQIRSRDMPFRARFLLLALADRHNNDSSRCNPSISRLCSDTGMHRETIMEAIKHLESENIIAVQRKCGAGSSYRFIGFNQGKQSADSNQSTNIDQSVNTDSDQSTNIDQSVNTDTEPGIEPIKEPKSIKVKKTSIAPEAFSEFYDAYPKKMDRRKAEAAWKKINPDESLLAKIMAGLNRAKKSHDWLKDDGRYIPYPATWLNGRRWEDDVESAVQTKKPVESFLGLGGLI